MSVLNIIKNELENKTHQTAVISTKDISFSQHVLDACKLNHCGRYNTNWMCPPAVDSMKDSEKKYRAYSHAFVFSTKSILSDCFDIEGMDAARERHLKIERELIKKLKGKNIDWLSAGSCNLCEKCTYPQSPCRHPEITRPSMEACGIDVVTLAKSCNISYYNGENTVTYFSMVLFNDCK